MTFSCCFCWYNSSTCHTACVCSFVSWIWKRRCASGLFRHATCSWSVSELISGGGCTGRFFLIDIYAWSDGLGRLSRSRRLGCWLRHAPILTWPYAGVVRLVSQSEAVSRTHGWTHCHRSQFNLRQGAAFSFQVQLPKIDRDMSVTPGTAFFLSGTVAEIDHATNVLKRFRQVFTWFQNDQRTLFGKDRDKCTHFKMVSGYIAVLREHALVAGCIII